MNKAILVAAIVSLASALSYADGSTGNRNILSVGCHQIDATCYVLIDGGAVSSNGCANSLIRWNSSTVWGKNWLALFMQAKATGSKVDLYIQGCYAGDPTFVFGEIR